MKKIFFLFITVILMVAFFGCAKPQPPALITVDAALPQDARLISADSNGEYLALFYVGFDEEPCYRLSLFDLRNNREINDVLLENGEVGYEVAVSEKGVALYTTAGEKTDYDLALKNPVTSAFPYTDDYQTVQNIGTINAERAICKKGFALSDDYGPNRLLVFYDRGDQLYRLKNNPYHEYKYADGHTVLVADTANNAAGNYTCVIRIFDFDTQQEINSLTVPNSYPFNNVEQAGLNGNYAIISTVKEDGVLDKVYVWNYRTDAANVPFEDGFCETVGAGELREKIRDACNRIKENTGVTIQCAPEVSFLGYAYDNAIPDAEFYKSLLDLEHYLSLLPKEVYREIVCKDLQEPVSSFDDFRIYLVGNFPAGNADAVAGNISCDETDQQHIVYIAYSCYAMNQKNFFHELMHTFEYRIWNYEQEFDENWMALNPSGFAYTEDYAACFYDEEHTAWQDYFARDYGMKNELEDRATCFEEICDGMLTDNCWWKEKPQLSAKQKYLAETLKTAFPSLNGVEYLNVG